MSARSLDLVGIGSMVVDRVHRAPRLLGAEQKAILRDVEDAGPVRRHVGGVVLNHLGWAAALGLRVGIFGRQAADAGGHFLRDAMDRAGIERDIALDGSASSLAEIFVDDAGERAIYMAPGATSETEASHVRRHEAFLRRGARLSTEVSQLPLTAVREALALARAAGIPTVLDLDVPPAEAIAAGLGDATLLTAVLREADLLKPARSAAQELLETGEDDALALATALRERFANDAVVVTDGAAGCAVAAPGFVGWVASRPVKAVDSTGAGDAFLGGLLAGLHYGLDWRQAAALGNACGAACVEQIGAFPERPDEARARVMALYTGSELALAPLPTTRSDVSPAAEALRSMDVTLEELAALRARLDVSDFESALVVLREVRAGGGRVHVTGVGKPEYLARYAASLLASTGTPATFLHGTEASHGSAGQLVEGDALIAVSNSGDTRELRASVTAALDMGARILCVTGRPDSWLGGICEVCLDAGVAREGGPLGLAPRASAAAELLVLAALAAALELEVGLSRSDYHRRHPGGALGDLSSDPSA
ncbi:MAG: SIS domain-containing protein [Myxococcales bacterium]|nr:SIS domain-containing protein [Myxococcales bacterium]